MKEWAAREGQTLKRCVMLSTFSLLLHFHLTCTARWIEVVKVSSKIGKKLKKLVPEVVVDV